MITKGFNSKLINAVLQNDINTVQALLKNEVNFKTKNNFDKNIFMLAGRALLEDGANLETKNSFGKTILMLAGQTGHTDIVKTLLDAGANVDARDKDGKTTLILAASHNHKEIVEILLNHGARYDMKDEDGLSALGWATLKGHIDIMQILLDKHNNLEQEEKHDNTVSVDKAAPSLFASPQDLHGPNICEDAEKKYENISLILSFPKDHVNIEELLHDKHTNVNIKSKCNAAYIGRVNTVDGGSYAVKWDQLDNEIYVACPNWVFIGKALSSDEAINKADKWLNNKIRSLYLHLRESNTC